MEALANIGRLLVRTPLVTAVITAVAVLGGGIVVFANNSSGAAVTEIFLEPADAIGANPFVNLLLTPVPTVVLARELLPKSKSNGTDSLEGGTVGLYGGTLHDTQCDRTQLITFLGANPAEGRAWAAVQGITVEQIPSYISELTPMQLRVDTRVTNHGFSSGAATPRQSVLQAGTAVLVDAKGVPRARCACGNPLLPPQAAAKPTFVGSPWSGFDGDWLLRITPTAKDIATFRLHEAATGKLFDRPAGTDGEADSALRETPATKPPPGAGQADESDPSSVAVPDLATMTDADALSVLRQAGLKATVTYVDRSDVAEGTVVAQTPEAGAKVRTGAVITMKVAKRAATSTTSTTVSVPNLLNLTDAAALAALRGVGLRADVDFVGRGDVKEGVVVGQDPPAGSVVQPGTPVRVTVAKAPPPTDPPPTAPTVKVPSLIGKTEAAAVAAAKGAGLQPNVSYVATSSVPAGTVLTQNPAAGVSIEPGGNVAMTVSTEPGKAEPPPTTLKVAVPNMVGLTQSGAVSAAQKAGLQAKVTTVETGDVPAGTVVRHDPAAGANVEPGATILLVVATAPPTTQPPPPPTVNVPDLVGKTEADAVAGAKRVGLRSTVTYAERSDVQAGTVVSQDPAAGRAVAPDSTVSLTVATAPPPPKVEVPNLIGLLEDNAVATAKQAQLQPTVTSVVRDDAKPGVVVEQKPGPGASVAPGSEVTLVVSKAPEAPAQVTVPDFVELSIERARVLAKQAGLALSENGEATNNLPCGSSLIVSQKPPAGTLVAPGTTIRVDFLFGPCREQ